MSIKNWNYINVMSSIKHNKHIKHNKVKDLYNNEYIGYKHDNNNVNVIKLINDIQPYNGVSTFLVNNQFYKTDEFFDTTNPVIVEKYIKHVKSIHPSKYTCLVLSGHNYTWISKELLKYQNKYMHLISPNNFSLRNCINNIGGVDILVFNTCCGMSVENLYDLRDCCSFLVGNMDYTGWKGIDEKAIINYLKTNTHTNPKELSKAIINHFATQLDGDLNYAISAYSKITVQIIRSVICELSYNLIKWINKDIHKNKQIIKSIRHSITYPNYKTGFGGNGGIDKLSVDLSKLCMELQIHVTDYDVSLSCNQLLNLLFDDKTSYRKSSDAFKGLCCLSIYFPIGDYSLIEEYRDIPFNKDNKNNNDQYTWYDFLKLV